MKTSLLTFLLMTTLLIQAATGKPTSTTAVSTSGKPEPAACTLTMVFANLTQRSGKIYIGLANDQASFSGSSYRKTRIEVPATGEVSFRFEGLPPGQYAVRVYQDLNENQLLDRRGPLPVEPFGFSTVSMLNGLPSFTQCAFDLTQNKQITIQLNQF